jgi:hypothetical protein
MGLGDAVMVNGHMIHSGYAGEDLRFHSGAQRGCGIDEICDAMDRYSV